MKIVLVVGHSKRSNGSYSGANGVINEYIYNLELAPIVADYIRQMGDTVDLVICPEGQFSSSTQEKAYKQSVVDNGGYDLAAELHLNAGGGTGAEVLYISDNGRVAAERVQSKLSAIFNSRGVKYRNDLYFLKFKPVAVMIESFFCDNAGDCAIGADKDRLARLIAEGLTGKTIPAPVPKTLYRVQCGAFRNKANAEDFRDAVAGKGFEDAYVKLVDGLYKVQVGAYSIRDNAVNMSTKLSAAGISNFIV